MTLDVEVRSSGPGPRARFSGTVIDIRTVVQLSEAMSLLWTRVDTTHRGRVKRCADGVAIIIRCTQENP